VFTFALTSEEHDAMSALDSAIGRIGDDPGTQCRIVVSNKISFNRGKTWIRAGMQRISSPASYRGSAGDLDHAAGTAVDREPEAMQLDDRRDQAQTKAGSEGRSALV
jgi:hypothetical protein